jgi:predicted Zn-dependent protease with MMP-like domain
MGTNVKQEKWLGEQMVTVEEMKEMLDEVAAELPEEFFAQLNGGIILLPEVKMHPGSEENDLYILGEYHHEGTLGRFIVIYYGSFMRVYGKLPSDALKKKLIGTVKHEFRHHLENMAGEYGLEIEDAQYLEKYKNAKTVSAERRKKKKK